MTLALPDFAIRGSNLLRVIVLKILVDRPSQTGSATKGPLRGDPSPLPRENRVRGHNARHLGEQFPGERLSLHRRFLRSSSVSLSRPLSCDLRTSSSAWSYSITACDRRLTQPVKITLKKCSGNRILINPCNCPTPPPAISISVRVFGHHGSRSETEVLIACTPVSAFPAVA